MSSFNNFFILDSEIIEMPCEPIVSNSGQKFMSSYQKSEQEMPFEDNLEISSVLNLDDIMNPQREYVRVSKLDNKEQTTNQEGSQDQLSTPTQQIQVQGQNLNQSKSQQVGFSKGVILYITQNKCPMFPLSRKINKTKKRGKYNKSYYAFLDEKMPNKQKGSSKGLDQKLQNKFEKMTPEEQEHKDVTIEAIRCLSTCQDVEAKRTLEKLQTKYFKFKERADFLDLFARLA